MNAKALLGLIGLAHEVASLSLTTGWSSLCVPCTIPVPIPAHRARWLAAVGLHYFNVLSPVMMRIASECLPRQTLRWNQRAVFIVMLRTQQASFTSWP